MHIIIIIDFLQQEPPNNTAKCKEDEEVKLGLPSLLHGHGARGATCMR